MLNTGTGPAAPPIDGLADTPYWTNREVVQVDRAARVAGRDRRRRDRVRAGAGVRPVRRRGDAARGGRPDPGGRGAGGQRAARRGVRARGHPGAAPASRSSGVATPTGGSGSPRGEDVTAEKLLVAAGRVPQPRRHRARDRRARPAAARPIDGRRADARRRGARGRSATSPARVPSPTRRCTSPRSSCATCSARTAAEADYRAVPRVTFTDPEVGSVGLTEAAGARRGARRADGQRRPRRVVPRLDAQAGNDGLVKLVADADAACWSARPRSARWVARCWRCWPPRSTPGAGRHAADDDLRLPDLPRGHRERPGRPLLTADCRPLRVSGWRERETGA